MFGAAERVQWRRCSDYCCYNNYVPCDNGNPGHCAFGATRAAPVVGRCLLIRALLGAADGACDGVFVDNLCKNWFQVRACRARASAAPV